MKLNLIYLIIISSILYLVLTVKTDDKSNCDYNNDCPDPKSNNTDITIKEHKINLNNNNTMNKNSKSNSTSKPPSLLKRLLSRFKIYYGDNDRPVTGKIASIKVCQKC